MTKFKLFYHRNCSSGLEVLQQRIQSFLEENGKVTELRVAEGSARHDMVILLTYNNDGTKGTQDISISGWVPSTELVNRVEELTDTTKVSQLSVFSSSLSSKRNVIIMLMERASDNKETCSKEETQESQVSEASTSEEQNENIDASSGPGVESGVSSPDRGVDDGGTKVDGKALHKKVRRNIRAKAGTNKRGPRKRGKGRDLEGTVVVQPEQSSDEDLPESSDT